jgi:predicted PolB exonuclease-like 3'-5' exonuclease
MSDVLTIDIETCQATNPDIIQLVKEAVSCPKTIKLQKSIDAWEKDKRPQAELDAISKTSFDGFAGEIISIGFAVNDEPPISFCRNVDESEEKLIADLFDWLTLNYGVNFNPLYVAHNIEFDMHFLYKRMVVHSIKPIIQFPVLPKAWDKHCFCTMHNSVGGSAGGSLDRISKVLGLGHKTEGIKGSDINQFWLDGRIEEIAEYNKQDVHLCREIYKRLKFIDKIGE